ncbi:putative mitochondrial seryl-tRNA synthetase, partial [Tilletiopsis washingtonensis]
AQHVSASGFPHFGEPLASLALALENYALRRARAKGAQLRLVPDVVPSSLVALSGFAPREDDAAQVYTLSAAFNDLGLSLAGTAELPLLAMHANRTYAKEDLPIFEVALSHSFRAEAGARGRESRGLYRVHQFSKAELFVVCRAEDSGKWLEKLVDLQVEILKPLGLCWRVLDMPTEELGASAFRKYDVEVWMPGRGTWGEVCSASNCTDFQSRRISTRAEGLTKRAFGWAHTLNATAAAIPRLLVAMIETHGFNAAGQPRVPEVLRRHWIGNERDVEW